MYRVLLLVGLVWGTLLSAQTSTGVTGAEVAPKSKPLRPIPEVGHVIVISIDGLRPDRALLADMSNLRSLIKSGAYTFWAKTTAVSITLPSHTSMLTGVRPGKHGIEWNSDLPLSQPIYPRVPTVFETASKAGLTTALIAGKSKFDALNKPGTVTYVHIPENDGAGSNAFVTEWATRVILDHKPDFMFFHYPEVDATGHGYGWGSQHQFEAIERVDAELGKILVALDTAGIRQSTTLIISADHGGAGRSHGADDARSRHIPWIMSGPGVREGFDLTQIGSLEVQTEDSAATSLFLLGLPLPVYLDGKPVVAAFLER